MTFVALDPGLSGATNDNINSNGIEISFSRRDAGGSFSFAVSEHDVPISNTSILLSQPQSLVESLIFAERS